MSTEILNGSRTSFGPRTVESALPYAVHVAGVRKQLVLPVKYNDLPTHVEGDVTGASIPANAIITAVIVTPSTTTFDGDRTFNVNLVTDADVAITTVQGLTVAQLNSGASITAPTDATVGSTGPAYVEVATTGGTTDATAGEGMVVIEYIDQIV